MDSEIDFVIVWVDGNDPEWVASRERYSSREGVNTDGSTHRFRDWDNLQYWFRGVEKFAPWVRRVHFVTCGHLPPWLNTEHPRLNVVKHSDYMPEDYLPTFSSHPIELNLHRIEGLANQFVYFNDDMFLIRDCVPEDFFRGGLPCDSAVLNVHCYNMDEMFVLAPFRDVGVINKYFDMREVLRSNPLKWFTPRYGINVLRNVYLLPCPRFPGFLQQHLPASYLKSTFEEVWQHEPELLDATCRNKFRSVSDVNQWVFKEWQLAKNEFYPRALSIGASIPLYADTYCKAAEYIEKQSGKMLCINDAEMTEDEFELRKAAIRNAFEDILPEKSAYEL